jgi:hypothetical protein
MEPYIPFVYNSSPFPFEPMTNAASPTIDIRVRTGSRYTGLLQTGVVIRAMLPCSIGDFLAALPGFSRDYIINRVQTIFFNGTAIDNLEDPLSGTTPTLALSAAMPGLAGAILRRNSRHAALRTQVATDSSRQYGIAQVRLKLFNMIAEERGETLLAAGVDSTGAELLDFFSYNQPLLHSITRILFGGEELGCDEMIQRLKTTADIHLTIAKDTENGRLCSNGEIPAATKS